MVVNPSVPSVAKPKERNMIPKLIIEIGCKRVRSQESIGVFEVGKVGWLRGGVVATCSKTKRWE